jgi:acyl-CoA reductase-like NAD-dependent aldehyde dehydrogenase
MSIPEATSSIPPSTPAQIDRQLTDLRAHADEWARLPIRDKVKLLWKLRRATDRAAGAWVTAAAAAKGLKKGDPLRGEEWSSGPWALLNYLGPLEKTLRAAERGRLADLVKGRTRTRLDGQVVARVMPDGLYDQLLFSGFAVDVWMQPGVTEASLPETMATFYAEKNPAGKVAVVLGAGNIASIAPLDVLYKLFAEGQVVLLKFNPVNEYLAPVFADVFADLIRAGYVRLATGGVPVGEYVTRHAEVDEIHVTGSAATHDAIVYGTGAEGQKRKAADTPEIDKRVTSELGGVSPCVVVPGPWTAADLAFQAEHVATMKTHNAGFNCIASQVLVLPEAWSLANDFTDAVRSALAAASGRTAYYPGAADRTAALHTAYPAAERLGATGSLAFIPDVPATRETSGGDGAPAEPEYAFTTEFFASALAVTRLPGDDPGAFLDAAVDFCNERLAGTLGMSILIHPKTIAELGPRFEDAIARLRYGTVGINAWSGVGFLIAQAAWGAFPGHERADIQSGTGVVHNALLFEKPQKTVVTAPFAPFPRSILAGEFHTSPRPPWFVTNQRSEATMQLLTRFAADPSPLKLPGIFASALRG